MSSSSSVPILYSYWRSSCSWRVRIALNLKGIKFEQKTINLLKGEQRNDELNLPFSLVPSLLHNNFLLTESMAIIEYLEEKFPNHLSLLPGTLEDRARIRAFTLQIVANTQPLQNLFVLEYLSNDLNKRKEWAKHWIEKSFKNLERELSKYFIGKYSYGNLPTILDCCIPPQVYNAKRFGINMEEYPIINQIDQFLSTLPEFKLAHANNQPDTPKEEQKF
ncbi:hypothetical protein Mgra_00005961 [Meloidogyne graminicola]|uniref:maleylacetoacetate isomerase n=1 Tax=Meloidogyne graminicola TaxID=189291 RepID=A0A8S9ZMH6_9BILA|nr:hypothetical protein Mgra_00005961 [Meloidogyne graminicola]